MEFLSRLVLDAPAAVLSWLGRQGTRAVAALIVIGIVMPSVGALLKPFVTEAVFVLLCIAFLRVDAAAFRIYLERPVLFRGSEISCETDTPAEGAWLTFLGHSVHKVTRIDFFHSAQKTEE